MNIYLDIYLENNVGDDLFLMAILERYPQHHFYILTQADYSDFLRRFPNLSVIKFNKFINFFMIKTFGKIRIIKKLIKKYKIDYFIQIGGSIFMEISGWEPIYQERNDLWNYLSNLHIPIYVLGANFGPYYSEVFLEKYKELFKLSSDICFRDEKSYELFKELPNVRIAPDIIFGLNLNNLSSRKLSNSLGISIISLENRNNLVDFEQVYFEKISQIIKMARTHNKEVYLFSFCKSEGDEKQINKIFDHFENSNHIHRIYYKNNIIEFIKLFSSMEYFIATRFHSIVLAKKFNLKTFVINYSSKSENLILENSLGYKMKKISELEQLSLENFKTYFRYGNDTINLNITSKNHFKNLDSDLR